MIERRRVKNDLVSIRNLHNLTRLDNMDNQAASRYVDQQPLRVDSMGQGAVKTWSAAKRSCDSYRTVFCQALRKPRLVMVEWDRKRWIVGSVRCHRTWRRLKIRRQLDEHDVSILSTIGHLKRIALTSYFVRMTREFLRSLLAP